MKNPFDEEVGNVSHLPPQNTMTRESRVRLLLPLLLICSVALTCGGARVLSPQQREELEGGLSGGGGVSGAAHQRQHHQHHQHLQHLQHARRQLLSAEDGGASRPKPMGHWERQTRHVRERERAVAEPPEPTPLACCWRYRVAEGSLSAMTRDSGDDAGSR